MKKIIQLIFLFFSIVLGACNKDDINNTDTKVGISRITNFPVFQVSGASAMSIIVGSVFTDPGVTAKEGANDIPVTISGSVDANKVGLYTLTYSAINKDGFSATTKRTVVVIPSAELPGIDLSGHYVTGAPSPDADITKVAPGVYFTTNCWGSGSLAVIPAYFICTDGTTCIIPLQDPGSGRIMTTSPGQYVAGTITWEIIRLDFVPPLTRIKIWVKQ